MFVGGTGYFEDGGVDLDQSEIEHHYPDYGLYQKYVEYMISQGRDPAYFNDYTDCFIGFSTRGCFRKCSFCVNKKFDKCKKHTEISNFVDINRNPERKRILLWDDNFLAYSKWAEILDELKRQKLPFQFRQGLDIRLMTAKRAKSLSDCRYYGDFIFAFDHIQDQDLIVKKLKVWRDNCKRETKLYLLCAYDPFTDDVNYQCHGNSLEERTLVDLNNTFKRISILMEYGCLPYIMRYQTYKRTKYSGIYTQLARWCNQPAIYKKMSFEEFCVANMKYCSNGEQCSSMRALKLLKRDAYSTYFKYAKLKYHKYLENLKETQIDQN